MKVLKTAVITLVLAVPISPISLVTADELVIKANTTAYHLGTEDYSPDMQEALRLAPVNFEMVEPVSDAAKANGDTAEDLPVGDVVQRTVTAIQ
jgi:hypothetical protein